MNDVTNGVYLVPAFSPRLIPDWVAHVEPPLSRIGNVGGVRFSTDWPAWLIVSGALAIALFVMWLYLRETSQIGSPFSWLLPAMRGTAVVLACLLLAGPVWHHRQVIGNPAQVVWAVDRSQSMGEHDSQSSRNASRLRRATDLLFGRDREDGWIESLRSTHLMDAVAFDNTARVAWSSQSPDGSQVPENAPENDMSREPGTTNVRLNELLEEASGIRTDLSAPLSRVFEGTRAALSSETDSDDRRAEDEQSASRVIVMFSDGRDSAATADAAEVATRLADAGWQVHAIGMGSVEESPDVGVVDVDVPERVADDGRLAGRVWVKHYGHDQQNVRVQIRSEGTVVWSDVLKIRGDGKTPVDFDFAVESLMARATANDVRGVNRDSVALSLVASVSLDESGDDQVSGRDRESGANERSGRMIDSSSAGVDRPSDATSANDSIAFRVAAASRDRRLLILDGSSRWEMRYLRNLFSRDPSWAVDTVLFGRGTDSPAVRRGDDAGELPDSQRSWARYDAVILGEIPPDQWTRRDATHLSEFVAGGGGLIVVDGRYGRIAELVAGTKTPLGPAASPMRSNTGDGEEAIMSALIPVRFDTGARSLFRTSWIEPTSIGRTHPVMMLNVGDERQADRDNADDVWKRLPAPASIASVTVQPDAEVWAEAVDDAGNRSPWLVTRLFGAGRVFYFSADQTWRWRYKIESTLHSRFWNQLMTAAMPPPYAVRDEFVAIGTDKIDYRVGQSATIRVRLLNGSPMENDGVAAPTVDALLLRDEQVIASIPLRLDDAQRRTYVGATDGLPAGEYRVRVRASGFDSAALKATTPFWVVPPRTGELDRLSLDETSLQRIANGGGGEYVHESSAEDILALLKPLSGGRIIESDTPLWQTWWVFTLIVMLLATEWWFRKKVGLV